MLTAHRRGLTLAEVLIALALVATVAAVLIPAVSSQLRRGQSASTATSLSNFRDAIVAYRANVLDYPRTLSQLTNALTVTATDACGNTLTGAQRNAWRGPYMSQNVTGNVTVGDATILDTLIRSPVTDAGTAPGTLILRAIDVDSAVAAEIDQQYDGTLDFAAGTVLWSNAGFDTLKFNIVIRNC